ncbi:MAG: type IV pilus modification protein PilV [Acinetobacter sp.]|nr:type IV pilus modification protein PilV [Acinetobacter sp.]
MNGQQGASLLEVLVAMLVLSVVILGFVALQVRATQNSVEYTQINRATALIRDLTERMRVNRAGQEIWLQASQSSSNSSPNCQQQDCTPQEFALYDLAQVQATAKAYAMKVAVLPCQNTAMQRQCIYVAWGDTQASHGDGKPHCTQGTGYVPQARCVMMEAYVY